MNPQIHDWFAHHEDMEFHLATRDYPFSVIPPRSDTDTVLYCTKRDCIGRLIHNVGGQPSYAAIMRGGLPSSDDVDWLRSIVGSRRLLFLGDADPPDLLTFAWLRQYLPIRHVGVKDELLLACGVPLQDNLTINLSKSELAALPLVTSYIDALPSELGEWCWGLLSSGRKIELEVLFSFATCQPSDIEAAILGDSS